MEQRRSVDLTHQVNRRDSHAKRANYTLYHDKHGFSAAVKIAYKAKENRSEQTVDGVGFQIIVGVGDHFSSLEKMADNKLPAKNAMHPMIKPATNAVLIP